MGSDAGGFLFGLLVLNFVAGFVMIGIIKNIDSGKYIIIGNMPVKEIWIANSVMCIAPEVTWLTYFVLYKVCGWKDIFENFVSSILAILLIFLPPLLEMGTWIAGWVVFASQYNMPNSDPNGPGISNRETRYPVLVQMIFQTVPFAVIISITAGISFIFFVDSMSLERRLERKWRRAARYEMT